MSSEKLREVLKLFNMHELAKKSGVGYSTLKNFSSGYREQLSQQTEERLIKTINSIKL